MENKRPCDGCSYERANGGCVHYLHCYRWREWFKNEWRAAVEPFQRKQKGEKKK